MLYSQIVLKNDMPFDLKLPDNRITAIDGMNNEQIGAELQKGLDSLKGGSFTPDDIDEMLKINMIYKHILFHHFVFNNIFCKSIPAYSKIEK